MQTAAGGWQQGSCSSGGRCWGGTTAAEVEGSAGADEGGGPLLRGAVVSTFCPPEWSAETGADRHEDGPSSASSVMSMSMQLTPHTAACIRGPVEQHQDIRKHRPHECKAVDTNQLAESLNL